MSRCLQHSKDTVGDCIWCGKKLCEKCVAHQEGRKYYCEKCHAQVGTLPRRTLPEQRKKR